MTVKLVGAVEKYARIKTGLHSFDAALAGGPRGLLIPGFPVRTITIVHGWKMSGKTTFVEWLAGRVAEKGKIAQASLEEYDPEFVQALLEEAGYSGEMHFVEGESDEEYIEALDEKMQDEDFSVGVFDSLGAILAISESEGKVGEANMGRRALLVSKLLRRARNRIRTRESAFSLLCINHQHPNIGSYGNVLSGGKTQEYMASNLIELSVYKDKDHWFDDGSHILNGKAEKVKFGPSGNKFQVFNLSGFGPHIGLSAVIDCIVMGLATKERTIKLGSKSFGFLKDLIESAKKGQNDTFQPFLETLGEASGKTIKRKGKRK